MAELIDKLRNFFITIAASVFMVFFVICEIKYWFEELIAKSQDFYKNTVKLKIKEVFYNVKVRNKKKSENES
jgi:hypothetical protein